MGPFAASSERSQFARSRFVGDPSAPIAAHARELAPAELEERPQLARDECGLMRPVLDRSPTAPAREAVEQAPVVLADAAERRKVVAALEDVDGVDLQQPEPVDHAVEGTGARGPGQWPGEALCGERDAAREGGRDDVDHDGIDVIATPRHTVVRIRRA